MGAGAVDDSFTFFPGLMDSASLFLAGNSDTVYFWGFIDLSDGPMVLDVPALGPPSGLLGTIDDMWFNWITDIGLPGPDRGAGGRYLIVGPGYDGLLPDSGFHVFHARTTRVTALGRGFMVDNDPKVPAEAIRNGVRLSPYVPGAQGTAVGTFLAGRSPLGAAPAVPETRFIELSGAAFNTIPLNEFGYWEIVNQLVQQEPPGSGDPELLGLLAAVGIVHGKPFDPGQRMRKILEEAVVAGDATARTVSFAPRAEEDVAYCPGSAWFNRLFAGGYQFLDPPLQITANGVVPARATAPASSTRARGSPTWRPASPRRCACTSPVSARNTSCRRAAATGSTWTAAAATGSPCRPAPPAGGRTTGSRRYRARVLDDPAALQPRRPRSSTSRGGPARSSRSDHPPQPGETAAGSWPRTAARRDHQRPETIKPRGM